MSSRSSARWTAAALALAVLTGCSSPAEEKPPSRAAPPLRGARGVKVPLVDGWTARVGADQSLLVGPAGRAVLRLDQRPGQAKLKPDANELLSAFSRSLDAGAATVRTKDSGGVSWVVMRAGGPLMLGAKAVGEDLFLCATLPGASEGEVESAVQACEGLEYASP